MGMYLHVLSTDLQLTLLMNSPYDSYIAGANTSEIGSIGRCLSEFRMPVCRIWLLVVEREITEAGSVCE